MDFSAILLQWYDTHKRDLPWRGSRDPYVVWLSEIILQQTRVAQGTPYFLRFLSAYPRVEDLAAASEEEVLKLWQGLGYYSRARNLHQTAREVAGMHGGRFPNTYKALLTLKGIGPYTAAAIASVCFDEVVPVVDGNVFRVLSRVFGVETYINTPAGQREFRELAAALIRSDRPGDFNQALMEFGAVHCQPKAPDCDRCPFSSACKALAGGRVLQLPAKQKGKAARQRRLHYLVPLGPDLATFLHRRTGRGIWQGLYQFPLLESEEDPGEEDIRQCLEAHLGMPPGRLDIRCFNPEPIVHKLSHQHLITTFWMVELEDLGSIGIPYNEWEAYPVPVLISKFMETVKNSYF